jgi:hypothetical protein
LNAAIMNYCHQRRFADLGLCAEATAEVLADLITVASKNNPEVARKLVRRLVHHMATRMEGKR